MITIFVPVYNEERLLEGNVLKLESFLSENLKEVYRIIIVDGVSSDRTPEIGKKLAKNVKNVIYYRSNAKGKGIQLKKASKEFDSEFYAFIDVDLPIRMTEFMNVITPVLEGQSDFNVASKFVQFAGAKRRKSRAFASKMFNVLVRFFLNLKVHDTIAGAKSWNRKVNETVWKHVLDKQWFFDTEMIYYATKKGFSVTETPVTYKDIRKDSKLNVVSGSFKIGKNLIGLWLREKL